MCGIVGLMTKYNATNTQIKLLAHLLVLDQLRGEHATGIAKVNLKTAEATVMKKALPALEFLNDEKVFEFLDKDRQRLYIGHNRFATMGNKEDHDNAHPFQEGHITMVHNGTIDRWTLSDLEGYDEKHIEVDSHMACATIAKLGIDEAVKKFSGAFSLVWWDANQRSLNFLRNEKRPMYIAHLRDGTMMWASEEAFIKVLIERDKTLSIDRIYSTAVNNHVRWEFDEKGDLLNDGKPVIRFLKIPEIPSPFVASRVAYGSRNPIWPTFDDDDELERLGYGNRRNQVSNVTPINQQLKSPDGLEIGSQQTVTRCNKELQEFKTHYRMGDRALLEFVSFDPYVASSGEVGTLTTRIETLGGKFLYSRNFNIRKSDIVNPDGGFWNLFRGTITNVYSTTGNYSGKGSEMVTCVSIGNLASAAFGSKSNKVASEVAAVIEKKQQPASQRRVSFPLKVHGGTIQTAQDLYDLTSNGCFVCGDIPSVRDNRNNHICLVNDGADFICGGCVLEDQTASEKANQ